MYKGESNVTYKHERERERERMNERANKHKHTQNTKKIAPLSLITRQKKTLKIHKHTVIYTSIRSIRTYITERRGI